MCKSCCFVNCSSVINKPRAPCFSLSKFHMTGGQARTVRMRISSCKTFVTSRPHSLSFHSPILTVKLKIKRRPPNYLSMISALIKWKKNWKEYLLYHLYKMRKKLPFACSPKWFKVNSVLALCTAISGLME